ncbi:hypothetical protein D918_09512 [Trichuris suis]|nr:hypothetical protein D918_09512 [Trichuris suis]
MSAANVSGKMSQYAPCVSSFPMTDKSWNMATAVGTNASGAMPPSTQLPSPSSSPKVSRTSTSFSTSPNGSQQQQAPLGNKASSPCGGPVTTAGEFLPSLMNTPGGYGPLSQFHAYRHGAPMTSHHQQHHFWPSATSTQAVPSVNPAAVSTFTSPLGSLESVSGYYLHQKPNYATTSMAAAQTSLDQQVSNAQDRWMQARLLLPPLSQGPTSSQLELGPGVSADTLGAQGPQQPPGGCEQQQFLSVKTESAEHQPLNQSSPAKLLNSAQSMTSFHPEAGLFQGFQGKSSSLGVQMSPREATYAGGLGNNQIRYPVPTTGTIVSPGASPYDQFHAAVSPLGNVDANRGSHYPVGMEQSSPNTAEATRLILKIKSSMRNERCQSESSPENRRASVDSLAESDDGQSQMTTGSSATSESSARTDSTHREAAVDDTPRKESPAGLPKANDKAGLANSMPSRDTSCGKYGENLENPGPYAHTEGKLLLRLFNCGFLVLW